jgi:NADPH-dependent curcumin reductase CurA
MLVRSIYLSLDPYMRGRMNAGKSYARPVEMGEVMEGEAVGEVVESQRPNYAAGDLVLAPIAWQEYLVSDGTGVQRSTPRYGPSPTRSACSACRA